MDGYVIEGHVPAEAIVELLEDRADVIGLALPGMPTNAPGMGGDEMTWGAQEILLIQADGRLVPFNL